MLDYVQIKYQTVNYCRAQLRVVIMVYDIYTSLIWIAIN